MYADDPRKLSVTCIAQRYLLVEPSPLFGLSFI